MMEIFDILKVVWPLLLLQIGLMVAGLVSITRRGETQYLPKIAWVVIVLIGSIVGPIVYFMVGRGELKSDELYRD